MNDNTILDIDLPKNTLQLVGVDRHHQPIYAK